MNLLSVLPSRQGHFLLESGYHADTWLDLDGLFVDQKTVAPLVLALADRLRGRDVSAVCGPLLGGAFLAQGLAHALGLAFYYTEPSTHESASGLFKVRYRLPAELRARIKGVKTAVVDDVISAGSSVRATIADLEDAGATTVVVGTFLLMGDTGANYFADQGLPVEALDRRPFTMWKPDDCPLCREGLAIQSP
jgi:orotate phosphoribosyltransferase